MTIEPIVIVGGGFVGLPLARALAHAGHKVTLIDPKERFLFVPRLIDALEDVGNPAMWTERYEDRAQTDGFTYIQASVERVERQHGHVVYRTAQGAQQELPYRTLILCQGTKACFYGIPGAAEHAMSLKSLDDIVRIHGRLHALVEEAAKDNRDPARERLVSAVVVGGGAAGVEAAFALRRYLTKLCEAHDPNLCQLIRVTLIQGGPQILPGFPHRIVAGTEREFKRQRISLSVQDPVTEVRADGLLTTKLGFVPAEVVLWCAGIEPSKIPVLPEVDRDAQGAIHIDRWFRAEPHIYAAGDAVTYRERNVIVPKNAQTAMQMAQTLCTSLVRLGNGRPPKSFHYHSHGNLVWLGDTGFLDVNLFSIKSKLVPLFRDLFYRFRFWQVTGRWM